MIESVSNPTGMRRQPRQSRSQERVKRILEVAEEMFATQGYNTTTTNAIAAGANVPIGSLYQFFPDKAAILQALAVQYNELLRQRLNKLTFADSSQQSIDAYITQSIDVVNQFFTDYPGYFATYFEVQGTMPELQKIEDAADAQLIQDFAAELSKLNPGLDSMDYEAISFVVVKVIGTLLWLSLNQEKQFRQRLVEETKRFTLMYLQSYFPLNR